ncbi:hypothetical protein AB1Y20_002297 [Prymnesium parvum]|uniref:Uncharacterized protein n=1 Tax=Prymnesium parvum TaxID=97485 RepID=A0AB34JA14_PRYPA
MPEDHPWLAACARGRHASGCERQERGCTPAVFEETPLAIIMLQPLLHAALEWRLLAAIELEKRASTLGLVWRVSQRHARAAAPLVMRIAKGSRRGALWKTAGRLAAMGVPYVRHRLARRAIRMAAVASTAPLGTLPYGLYLLPHAISIGSVGIGMAEQLALPLWREARKRHMARQAGKQKLLGGKFKEEKKHWAHEEKKHWAHEQFISSFPVSNDYSAEDRSNLSSPLLLQLEVELPCPSSFPSSNEDLADDSPKALASPPLLIIGDAQRTSSFPLSNEDLADANRPPLVQLNGERVSGDAQRTCSSPFSSKDLVDDSPKLSSPLLVQLTDERASGDVSHNLAQADRAIMDISAGNASEDEVIRKAPGNTHIYHWLLRCLHCDAGCLRCDAGCFRSHVHR